MDTKNLILYYNDVLYRNYDTSQLDMMTEVLTIGAILASCGLLTWVAMKKYQPKINAKLAEIESRGTGLEITKKKIIS